MCTHLRKRLAPGSKTLVMAGDPCGEEALRLVEDYLRAKGADQLLRQLHTHLEKNQSEPRTSHLEKFIQLQRDTEIQDSPTATHTNQPPDQPREQVQTDQREPAKVFEPYEIDQALCDTWDDDDDLGYVRLDASDRLGMGKEPYRQPPPAPCSFGAPRNDEHIDENAIHHRDEFTPRPGFEFYPQPISTEDAAAFVPKINRQLTPHVKLLDLDIEDDEESEADESEQGDGDDDDESGSDAEDGQDASCTQQSHTNGVVPVTEHHCEAGIVSTVNHLHVNAGDAPPVNGRHDDPESASTVKERHEAAPSMNAQQGAAKALSPIIDCHDDAEIIDESQYSETGKQCRRGGDAVNPASIQHSNDTTNDIKRLPRHDAETLADALNQAVSLDSGGVSAINLARGNDEDDDGNSGDAGNAGSTNAPFDKGEILSALRKLGDQLDSLDEDEAECIMTDEAGDDSSEIENEDRPAVEYDEDEEEEEDDDDEHEEISYSDSEGDVLDRVREMEAKFQTFSLKVIHPRRRTGFEEHKKFPIRINSLITARYQVKQYIGSAAFSRAVQCLDLKTGEMVCIKIIKNKKDFFDQSLDEIKLLHLLGSRDLADRHHILHMHDYFYFKEHLFIVTELLRDNLYEFSCFNRKSEGELYFTLPRLRRIAKQCLEALAFVHSLGLMHCDLKPENILIKSYSRCEIKIIDFGSSCFTTDHLSSYVQSRSYRAPEVILGLPYDAKIDLWSLGTILAELFTGYVLFQNDSIATMLARLVAILGPFPAEMIDEGRHASSFFSNNEIYEIDESGHLHILKPKETSLYHRLHTDDGKFLSFVNSMLQIDPAKRPTALQALNHPWIETDPYR